MTTFLPRPAGVPAAGGLSPATDLSPNTSLVAICPADRLLSGRGVAALLPDGRQVAVFLVDDEVHALCNIDPVARAAVMSRGLVGDRGGVPVVISPLGKQAYALADGRGLDDPAHGLSVFPVRVTGDGTVVIAAEPAIRHAAAA